MKKKILSLLLSFCMVCSMLPMTAGATGALTDMHISESTDLSGYTSPAAGTVVTLTIADNATLTLSGGVTLNNTRLVIGTGATVTLDHLTLGGYLGADGNGYLVNPGNTPGATITGQASSTLIVSGGKITGFECLVGFDNTADFAAPAAVSGVGTVICKGGATVKGGQLDTQRDSQTLLPGQMPGRAVENAQTVYAMDGGSIACGGVKHASGLGTAVAEGKVTAITSNSDVVYYYTSTSAFTAASTGGTATRLCRLKLTNATATTSPASTLVNGSDTLNLYAAGSSVTINGSNTGGFWQVFNKYDALADATLKAAVLGANETSDTLTFSMPSEDITLLHHAAYTGEESWTDGIAAVTDTWDAGGTISTPEALAQLAYNVNHGKTYAGQTITLGADINLSGRNWTPIGTAGNPFGGTFEGGNHTVTGITITGDQAATKNYEEIYLGLFGYVYRAVVKQISLEQTAVTPTLQTASHSGVKFHVGGLAGKAEESIVNGVHISGNLTVGGDTSTLNLGGVAGHSLLTTIINSSAVGTVGANGLTVSYGYLGGIAGVTEAEDNSCILNSFSNTALGWTGSTGSKWIGGIAGEVLGDNLINLYAVGTVPAGSDSLVGLQYDGNTAHLYAGAASGVLDTETVLTEAQMKGAPGTEGALVGQLNNAAAMQAVNALLASSAVPCNRTGVAPLLWGQKDGANGGYPTFKQPEAITTQPTAQSLTVAVTTENGTPMYQWETVAYPVADMKGWTWDDGKAAWRSAPIGDSDLTILLIPVTADASGSVTFSYAVSSEAGYDKMTWKLCNDASGMTAVPETESVKSGELPMTEKTLTGLTPSTQYYLLAQYNKDSADASGSDCCWIRIPGTGISPIPSATAATLNPAGLDSGTVVRCVVTYPWGETLYSNTVTLTDTPPAAPHVHDGVTFLPWPEDNNTQNGGSYYFTKSMTGSLTLMEEQSLTLCLNGHALDADGNTYALGVAGTLDLYDCNGSGGSHAVTADGQSHTVTGGLVTGGSRCGAYVDANGVFTLHGGTIAGNTAGNASGGGVYAKGKFTMNGGEVSYNTANSAGGVYGDCGSAYRSAITLNDGKISNNRATGTTGGGLYVIGDFTMNGGQITGNTAADNGGGLAVGMSADNPWAADARLNGGSITGNHSAANGGGIRVTGGANDLYPKLTLSGTAISGNTAALKGAQVHVGGKVLLDTDCGNQSIYLAGALPLEIKADLAANTAIALDANGTAAEKTLVTGVTSQSQASCFTVTNLGTGVEHYYQADATAIKTRALPSGTVSGSVTDDGETPAPAEGITVKLRKGGTGGTVVASMVTAADGLFRFETVPYGSYTLTATRGGQTISRGIVIQAAAVTQTLVLPTGDKNTTIEVAAGTPSTAVNGLETAFTPGDTVLAASGAKVEIKLAVRQQASGALPTGDAALIAAQLAGNQTVGLYLDLQLLKSISGAASGNVSDALIQPAAGSPLQLILDLPAALQGKAEYRVIRVHGGAAAQRPCTYDSVLGTLTTTADLFSTYAIVYSDSVTLPPTNNNSSSGGSGSAATVDRPAVIQPDHGVVSLSPATPAPGQTVIVTVKPDTGYTVKEVTVTDGAGQTVPVTQKPDGTLSFIQPKTQVKVTVTLRPPVENFTDVPSDAWYSEGVRFVYEQGWMSGVSDTSFAPTLTTSRAMIATILWRMAGEPKPVNAQPFADVPEGQWHSQAIAWAAEKGVVKGVSADRFEPSRSITRQELTAMLYRYAVWNKTAPTGTWAVRLDYTDVAEIGDWAMEGAMFAQLKGLVGGKAGNRFAPRDPASRAELAVILQRFAQIGQ